MARLTLSLQINCTSCFKVEYKATRLQTPTARTIIKFRNLVRVIRDPALAAGRYLGSAVFMVVVDVDWGRDFQVLDATVSWVLTRFAGGFGKLKGSTSLSYFVQ